MMYGLCLALKFVSIDCPFAEKQYADLSAKPFFNGLAKQITSGLMVAMIIGATNPLASKLGTIRGDSSIDISKIKILSTEAILLRAQQRKLTCGSHK
ncbi:Nucleoside diphosphate kinase 1, partial [Bienertia sinuspersici]